MLAEAIEKIPFRGFRHLKSREVRRDQVAQVVLGRSVSSGLLLHQRRSLDDKRELIFLHIIAAAAFRPNVGNNVPWRTESLCKRTHQLI